MWTRSISVIAVATFAVTGCGGGDGGGQQAEVADMLIESAAADGMALDEECVRDTAKELSDDDAAKIVAAGIDGNPDVSPEADAVGEKMFNCLDTDAFVDQIVQELGGDEAVDADCLKRALSGLTPDEFESDEAVSAMFECMDLGG